MEQSNKLDRFFTAVNTVTEKQVNDILAEAEEEKNYILSSAQNTADEEKKRYISDNMKMASNRCLRMVSKAELDMKKEILARREELTSQLFERVYQKIAGYRRTPEYEKALCAAIAGEQELENARISVSPEDMRFKEKILKAAGGSAEVVADESIVYGGFTVLRPDKGTITDRTYDCAIKTQQSLFASKNLFAAQEGDVR